MLEKHISIGMEGYQVIWGRYAHVPWYTLRYYNTFSHQNKKGPLRITDIWSLTTYILQNVYCHFLSTHSFLWTVRGHPFLRTFFSNRQCLSPQKAMNRKKYVHPVV